MWLLPSLWLCTSLGLTAEDSKLTKFLPVFISAPQGSGSGQLEVRKISTDQLCCLYCPALLILNCSLLCHIKLPITALPCTALHCPGQVLLPTRGSSAIGSPAQLLEHVGASWETVVEPHQVEQPALLSSCVVLQAGLVEPKQENSLARPGGLSTEEVWHHWQAGQAGVVDSARSGVSMPACLLDPLLQVPDHLLDGSLSPDGRQRPARGRSPGAP